MCKQTYWLQGMAAAVGSARVTNSKRTHLRRVGDNKEKSGSQWQRRDGFSCGSGEERPSHFFLQKCPDLPDGLTLPPGPVY